MASLKRGTTKPTPAPARTQSITAAAKRIPLGTETGSGAGPRAARLSEPAQWQRDAWDAFDQIGQVKAPYLFIANAMARLRLFPAVQLEEDAPPVHVDLASGRAPDAPDEMRKEPAITTELADAITEELARITNPLGGQAEILRLFALCLGVPGECYLVGRTLKAQAANDPRAVQQAVNRAVDNIAPTTADVPPEGEREREVWEVYSNEELRKDPNDDRRVVIVSGENATPADGIPLTEDDVVVRVWRRHPRWKNRPDSHMRAALTDCDELLAMSRAFQATMMSRNNAGILTFPSELNNTRTDEHGDAVGDGSDDKPRPSEALADSMIAPVADPTNAASVVPHIIVGQGQYLSDQYIRHIDLARDWPQIAAEEREKAIDRLAQSLPIPPEVVTGKGDVNHWTAWQIADETYQAHIEPEAQLFVDAILEGVLRPALRARMFDEESVAAARIGIDPSELVVNPNRLGDAKELHKSNALSDAALRREANFSETDAPDDEELLRRTALDRGIFTADLTVAMLKAFMEAARAIPAAPSPGDQGVRPTDADSREVTPDGEETGPPPMGEPETDGEPPAVAASALVAAALGGGVGARLTRIDRALRDRLAVAVDNAMRRAMERAGAKLRSKGQRNEAVARAASAHPNAVLTAALGPSLVAALDMTPEDLVPDDAFDGLRDQWDAWVARAQREALEAVAAEGELSEGSRAQIEREQDDDREAGWLLLLAALLAHARSSLFSPDASDEVGAEFDPTLTVPPGVVREALARAGGETHVGQVSGAPGVPTGGGAGVARRLLDAAGRPAGGVSTGSLLRRAIAEAGLAVGGFRWHYGDPSTRQNNFEPHRALDGVELATWEDTVLRVGSEAGWLRTGYYYPGDHAHCQCDYELIVGPAVAPGEPAAS